MNDLSISPSTEDFWFLPLGGTGEIGMNMNLYGHSDSWIMVDCGATFNAPLDHTLDQRFDVKRHDVVIPDAEFITARKDKLCAIVITHAHEDHIGALTHVWPNLQVPIYATAFAAEVIRRKFYRQELYCELPIVEIEPGDMLDIGPFTLKWLSITHSIPETQAILITTPVGKVFHTADWKIDPTPVVGHRFKARRFKSLEREDISAMVCDSTNALKSGYSTSEMECQKGLEHVIKKQQGRVIVTCFASNLARLISLAKIAESTGRYMTLFGRSLDNMVSIARQLDLWPEELKTIPPRHIGYLPANEVLIVATGSQGEPRAALNRLAQDNHRLCELNEKDCVIFSSFVIPGNEAYVEKVVQQLKQKHVKVIMQKDVEVKIHASGHPNENDLQDMYEWVKPKTAIPTHGEEQHMQANAQISQRAGIKNQLVGRNGDLFEIAPNSQLHKQVVNTARVPIKQ